MKHQILLLFSVVAFVYPVTAQTWLTTGLVASYPLDNSAADVTGNGADGTMSEVTFGLDRFNASHRAATFSGSANSFIAINSTNWNLAPEFTASIWCKFTSGGTENPRIISAAGFELGTQTTADSRPFFFNNTTPSAGAFTVESSNSVPAGVWTHVVGVRTSNELVLYLNGVKEGALAIPEPPDYTRGLPEIGGNFGNGFDALAGSVDDVRIYNRALSSSEVLRLFQKESTPPGGLNYGLVAYYPFSGNANDESGHGNHGIVHGALLTTDQFGKTNRAFGFDGTNSSIELPSAAFGVYQAYTLSLWFNASRLPNSGDAGREAEMLLSRGRNNFELHLGAPPFADTGIRFLPRQANGVGQVRDARTAAFQTNVWNHVVAVYDDTTQMSRIYLNGQELTITALNGPEAPDDAFPPRLGVRYDGTVPFQGRLDNVRIYDRALSAGEIARLHAAESGQLLTIRKAVYADSTDLTIGTAYQLQLSTDLVTWTNHGAPFNATNSTWRSDYQDVENWGKLYLRLQPQ
jgi:hypothetical protein